MGGVEAKLIIKHLFSSFKTRYAKAKYPRVKTLMPYGNFTAG